MKEIGNVLQEPTWRLAAPKWEYIRKKSKWYPMQERVGKFLDVKKCTAHLAQQWTVYTKQ